MNTREQRGQNQLIERITQKCLKIVNIFEKAPDNNSFIDCSLEKILSLLQIILEQALPFKMNTQQYSQIQNLLQQQENLNRSLIKKELQFREEKLSLVEELHNQKQKIKKLSDKVANLTDKLKDKDLQILHMKSELKATQREINFIDTGNLDFLFEKKTKKQTKQPCKQATKSTITTHRRGCSEDFSRKSINKYTGKKKNRK